VVVFAEVHRCRLTKLHVSQSSGLFNHGYIAPYQSNWIWLINQCITNHV